MLTRMRLVALSLLLVAPAEPGYCGSEGQFQTYHKAAQHCPRDVVVWVNTQSRTYHLRGERSFANTENGAFVCKHEADQNGYRPAEAGHSAIPMYGK